MTKPTIQEIAVSVPENPGAPMSSVDNTVLIPGFGKVRKDQAKSEAVKRMRMLADALEQGKNVPSSAIELTIAFMKACC